MATSLVTAWSLRPGDAIDLEFDEYADPYGDDIAFQHEYQVVERVTERNSDSVQIELENGSTFVFPKDHTIFKLIEEANV